MMKNSLSRISSSGCAMAVALLVCAALCRAERIKDIVEIQGIRSNPLWGTGLVVGLSKSGDSSLPSRQMLTNILRRSGLVFNPVELGQGSIAIVMVTAELGPFDRMGSKIDVVVSTVGDAVSLQGGTLYPTPLTGLDGQVYAVASGAISLGGFGASGKGASVSVNHQNVGRIPAGASVEREEIADFVETIAGQRYITLNLRNKDFSTAQRISDAVNQLYVASTTVSDAGTIKVRVPDEITQPVIAKFIDDITKPDVKVDVPAVVVVNERTGTIVVGENVGISAVAISQGSLVVKVKETEYVSQPIAPLTNGTTEKTQDTEITAKEEPGHLIPVNRVVTVAELARALNAIGATPRDLIAIFNALKQAGALQAKLEIM
jgi:flagellar P-ring protein precursor FlgI